MEDALEQKVFAKVTRGTEILEESAVKQAAAMELLRNELNELQAQAAGIRKDVEKGMSS